METMICAYCGQEIKKEDYRVYCPSCHADFHKDCWLANNGCVTEGCEYNRRPMKTCAYCQTPIKKEYVYCKKCGRPTNPLNNVVTYPQGSDFHVPDTEADTAVLLVGKNSESILRRFAKLDKTKNKLSWNFPAFIFTGFWFIFRKMYAQGFVFLLLLALFGASAVLLPGFRFLTIPLLLLVWVGCGLCADGIYMERIRVLAKEALEVPENLRLEHIFKVGGIDKKFAAIAAVAGVAAIALFALFANAVI